MDTTGILKEQAADRIQFTASDNHWSSDSPTDVNVVIYTKKGHNTIVVTFRRNRSVNDAYTIDETVKGSFPRNIVGKDKEGQIRKMLEVPMDTSELTVTVEFSHTEDHPEWPFMAQVDIRTDKPVELHQLMKETADGDLLARIHNPRDVHQRGVAMGFDFQTMGTKHSLAALKTFLDTCDKLGITQRWTSYNPRTYYTDMNHALQNIK